MQRSHSTPEAHLSSLFEVRTGPSVTFVDFPRTFQLSMSHSHDNDVDLSEELRKATSDTIPDESRKTANQARGEETKSSQSSGELLEGIKGLISEGSTLAARLLDCQGLSKKAGLPSQTQGSLKRLWDVGITLSTRLFTLFFTLFAPIEFREPPLGF